MTVTARQISAAGFLGYRLTQSTTWTTGGGTNAWSGCYIGSTLAQSKGYVDIKDGVVRVWSITLVGPYPFWCIHGAEIADPSIPSDVKAQLVIAAIQVAGQTVPPPLIPSLCAVGQGYVGPDTDNALEIILGWSCLGAIVYTAYRDYQVKNYEIIAWSPPGLPNWQPISTDPGGVNSPIPC
jgi:hypothetical protein